MYLVVIILEGNECNFKTTVADKLSKATGFEIVKGSTFEMAKCSNEELYEKFLEFTKLDDVIIDRFLWSNLVYASLYEDYSILTLEQAKDIQRKLLDKAYLLYLYADDSVLVDRISVRGDDYVKPDKIQSINKRYWEVLGETLDVDNKNSEFVGIKGNMIDTSVYNSDEIMAKTLKELGF